MLVLNSYKYILINMVMTFFVFFIASNAILSNYDMNVLNKLDSLIGYNISNLIYIVGGISIIFLVFKKHTWLPFLGQSVLPPVLLPETVNVGDTTIKIKVKPNTKVAYWSSLPSNDKKPKVEIAYGDFSNAGVSKSDENGFVTITFNKGTGYVVPSGRFIKPHIHYRELNEEWSMMGPVNTIYL